MDIKAEIQKIIDKVKNDSSFKDKFMKDPAGTVKGVVGDKADNDTIQKIVDMIKIAIGNADFDLSKIDLGDIGDKISGALGGLFGKKDD